MRASTTYLLAFNGCFLILSASEAAPRKLPPTLPPRNMAQKRTPRKPTAKIKAARKKLPPLPATGSKLSVKPRPRTPSSIAATGRTNPDSQSVGLADQRVRANASAPLLSLEDTIALSLANNPQRTQAQAAVDAATANISAVGSQGKLQVGANGTTEYGRNTQTSNGLATAASSGSGSGSGGDNGGDGNGSTSTTPSRSFLRFDQLSVNASLPITTGGRVKASTRQARYQAVAQIYQLAQVEQDLILSTTLSYLDVLRATQLLRVTNANLSVSQERLRIARLRYGVGASARLDVLRAQTDLADARSRRIQAVNSLGTSNSNLNVLLGRAPETPIRIASITRLNLPNVAYTIAPSSVLPSSQGQQNSSSGANGNTNQTGNSNTSNGNNAGTGTTGNQNGGATNTGRTNANSANSGRANTSNNGSAGGNAGTSGTSNGGNRTNTGAGSGSPATGTTPGAVFGGPSAPSGNISSGAIGPTNSTTPGASGNTTNQAGASNATGGVGATSTAGATNPTGAANPSGATTTGAGGSGAGGATATTGGTTGSTAGLNSGSVSGGASTGLQSLAGGTRQSLAVTQAQIGAAEAAVEIAKSGKRPQLSLNLGTLLRNPATFLGNFGASIGLGLAQNLFDSRRTRSQVDTARAALLQLQARLAGQRLEVAGAIETSLLNLDSAQQRQASADAGARSAQEALRVAQIGFRSGVRTTLDLADAQAALLAAQTDAVNSRFDVADAQATLAAAVGIYTVEAQNARERAIRDEQEAAEQARRQIEILQPKPKKKRKKFLGIF